jgi:hypothetical protein
VTNAEHQELCRFVETHERCDLFLQDFARFHYPIGTIVYVNNPKRYVGYGISAGIGNGGNLSVTLGNGNTWDYPLTTIQHVPDSDPNVPRWVLERRRK